MSHCHMSTGNSHQLTSFSQQSYQCPGCSEGLELTLRSVRSHKESSVLTGNFLSGLHTKILISNCTQFYVSHKIFNLPKVAFESALFYVCAQSYKTRQSDGAGVVNISYL